MNKFGSARLFDQSLQVANPLEITPQERVNLEMFKAIELLGRRLERAENERDRLAGRLAQIESSATVDEKTGKLYLPVVVDPAQRKSLSTAPGWMVAATLMSSALALCALGFAVTRDPGMAPLTGSQLAALNALTTRQTLAGLQAPARWKSLDEAEKEDAGKVATVVPAVPVTNASATNASAAAPVANTPATPAPGTTAAPAAVADAAESEGAKFLAQSEINAAAAAPGPADSDAAPATAENAEAQIPLVDAVVPDDAATAEGPDSGDVAATPPVVAATPPVVTASPPVVTATPVQTSSADGEGQPEAAAPEKQAEEKSVEEISVKRANVTAKPSDVMADAEMPINVVSAHSVAAEASPEAAPPKTPAVAAKPVVAAVHEKSPVTVSAKAAKPSAQTAQSAMPQIAPDPTLPTKLADLEKRAFAGKPEAQHDLATVYAAGKVVGQDYKRAVYWFSRAADGGIANADYNLGVMFQQGMGVHKDIPHALAWYEKAAQLGHPEAMYNLGIAYVEGVGTGRDVERGVGYFKKAANAGVAQAAYNLGVLYESNFVGPIDLAKAAEWYQVAADQGHVEARRASERVREQIAESTRAGDQGLKLATAVEPAAGQERGQDGAYGEGDATLPGEVGGTTVLGDASSANRATSVTASGALPLAAALLTKIQAVLIAHGDLPGAPTGVMDQKTEDAIRAWQSKLGLPVNGQPSQILLDKIAAAVPAGK